MQPTENIRIKGFQPIITPETLKAELPRTPQATETVLAGRNAIENIISQKDHRLLVISGPCSIHEETAALEYAERLKALSAQVADNIYVVMRVYFEKPRTTVGWKGLINDPYMNGTYDIDEGLHRARRILLKITEMGLPTATELLDPITPQYFAGLVCWAAIGARTTESQTHREMASGLSMPVGFKNGTDGNLSVAVNAMLAARAPQTFLGIENDGSTSIVHTTGNPFGHIVLRGGRRPNYDPVSLEDTSLRLTENNLPNAIMVDCSHANSGKRFAAQGFVWKSVIEQRLEGNTAIMGLMLESHLNQGNQKIGKNTGGLKYGVSITDACVNWETTEQLLHYANDRLGTH
jgi:3-deoxy-7-phosphoheptulonate synthase